MKIISRVLISFAVFVVSAILMSVVCHMLIQESARAEEFRYHSVVRTQAAFINNAIDKVLSRVLTLRQLVISENGDTDFFERQVPDIIYEVEQETGVHLKNIAIAPNGIVKKVSPLYGNETFLNFNLLDPTLAGNGKAIESYHLGQTLLTNPFNLVQGGIGMVARAPIFLRDKFGNKVFWGLVTVTMDCKDLLKALNLNNLESMGLSYKLWYNDHHDQPVFLSYSDNRQYSESDTIYLEIYVKNLEWHLACVPKDGLVPKSMYYSSIVVVITISLLLALLSFSLITIKQSNSLLRHLANMDGLTMAFTRHFLRSEIFSNNQGDFKNDEKKYSLAVIDIDDFKTVNDTFGHDKGDHVLKTIAGILSSQTNTNKGDCVIRYGGDEFIVIWTDIPYESFITKLDTIVKAVKQQNFYLNNGIHLSVSVGGQAYSSTHKQNFYELLRLADINLYKAKKNGKNGYYA